MRIFHRPAALVVGMSLWAVGAAAHQPHDVVPQVALSPAYAQDGTLFAVGLEAPVPHRSVLLRSLDGGISWRQLRNGLDPVGNVNGICLSPTFATDQTVLAITTTDGAYASTDGGETWQNISSGLHTTELAQIACGLDAQSKLVLLVAGTATGLSRSDDLGATWTTVQNTIKITALELSPEFSTNGVAVAGGDDGTIYFSKTGGDSWNILTTLPGAGTIFDIELASGGSAAFLATRDGGLYRTTNGGQSFEPLIACLPTEPVLAVDLSPSYASDQTLFVGTGVDGVFKSTNGGDCFTKYQSGIDFDSPLLTQYRFFDIEVSPSFQTDQTIFTGMFEGLFRSVDGGSSWFQLETQPRGAILDLALSPGFDSDTTLALSRYGGGASISTDAGSQWAPANVGLENPFLYDVTFSPDYANDATLFTLHAGRLSLKSTNRGASWVPGPSAPGSFPTVVALSPDFTSDETAFVGSRADGISRSTDGGQIWTTVLPAAGNVVNSLIVSPDFATDSTVFAGRQVEGVLRSVDGGDSWQPANDGLHVDGDRGPLLAISPSFGTEPLLLAGTLQGLFLSSDAGANWQGVTTPPALTRPIEAVAISPNFGVDRTLLASVRGTGLFRSTDAGGTWSEVAPSVIQSHSVFQGIRFSPAFATDDTLYAFSNSELFVSLDAGSSWSTVDPSPVRHEDDRPVHQWNFYEGAWQKATWALASANKVHLSQVPGDRARFFFYGTGVTWIGVRGDFLGIAEVYLDGVLQWEVDQYGAALESLIPLYSTSGLPLGLHELEIVVTDRKHPDATSVGAAVDAFDVVR